MTMLPMDPEQFQIPTTHFNLPPPESPKKRGGMFGSDSPLRGVAGMIGDYLLQRSGMNPVYSPTMQQHRQFQMEQEQYQRQRSDGMQDWMAKQRWELENRQPDYDAFQKHLIEGGVRPGTPEWVAAHKRKSEFEQNPMVMTAYGPMPYSAVAGQQPQQALPPTLSDDDFQTQGGPSPLGSGGFSGPY